MCHAFGRSAQQLLVYVRTAGHLCPVSFLRMYKRSYQDKIITLGCDTVTLRMVPVTQM